MKYFKIPVGDLDGDKLFFVDRVACGIQRRCPKHSSCRRCIDEFDKKYIVEEKETNTKKITEKLDALTLVLSEHFEQEFSRDIPSDISEIIEALKK
jgi:hypothetical protein